MPHKATRTPRAPSRRTHNAAGAVLEARGSVPAAAASAFFCAARCFLSRRFLEMVSTSLPSSAAPLLLAPPLPPAPCLACCCFGWPCNETRHAVGKKQDSPAATQPTCEKQKNSTAARTEPRTQERKTAAAQSKQQGQKASNHRPFSLCGPDQPQSPRRSRRRCSGACRRLSAKKHARRTQRSAQRQGELQPRTDGFDLQAAHGRIARATRRQQDSRRQERKSNRTDTPGSQCATQPHKPQQTQAKVRHRKRTLGHLLVPAVALARPAALLALRPQRENRKHSERPDWRSRQTERGLQGTTAPCGQRRSDNEATERQGTGKEHAAARNAESRKGHTVTRLGNEQPVEKEWLTSAAAASSSSADRAPHTRLSASADKNERTSERNTHE